MDHLKNWELKRGLCRKLKCKTCRDARREVDYENSKLNINTQ